MTSEEGARNELPKECKGKINQRKGHRSYVTRVTKQVDDILSMDHDEKANELLGKKVALTEKLKILQDLDDKIMEYLSDEDTIEKEYS